MTDRPEHAERVAEHKERLWTVAAPPAIWALHFVVAYTTAALWCGRLGGATGDPATVRVAIAIYTVVALIAVGWLGWRGYRRHRLGNASPPHERDTPEDRHRFLGYVTLLLAGVSALAILFEALVVVFVRSCT